MEVVNEEYFDRSDTPRLYLGKFGKVNFLVALDNDLAGCRINDIVTGKFTNYIIDGNRDKINTMFGPFPDGSLGELPVRLDDHFTGLRIGNINSRLLVCQQF